MRIRKVKNSSGNIVVQVGYYQGKNFILVKHVGSAKNKSEEIKLIEIAKEIIHADSISFFSSQKSLSEDELIPLGYSRTKAYTFLKMAFDTVFPDMTDNDVFRDFTIIRIIEATSKLESLNLLREYFGIKYSYAQAYRQFLRVEKEDLVKQLAAYAKQNLNFSFSLLFYDVTTLYFDSKPDENLKIPGYSKDGKHSKPQIMIGLAVDSNGFPIYYDIFKGNSFEGHTMLPVILEFKNRFKVKELTIVADSAMLSADNLELLEKEGLHYIVGNRKHVNFGEQYRKIITKIKKHDNSSYVLKEDDRFTVFHFSEKRQRKDLYEIDKACSRAEKQVQSSKKIRKSKFIKTKNEKVEVNYELIEKHRFLAGIKTYKTDMEIPAQDVIDKYKDLWKVERAFRMSKSDLRARPIFHRKEEPIKAHIQLVFAANAVSKHIEMQTGLSIKRNVNELMREVEVSFKVKGTSRIMKLNVTPH